MKPSDSGAARRGARALVALVFLLGPAAGRAQEEPTLPSCEQVLPPDLLAICERGVLRFARYGGERPPFFTQRDGQWVGFDVDLARDMARRMGLRYEEDATAESFDEVVDKVARGEADIALSKLSATLERALRVRFSRPYLTVYQALLVNRLAAPRASDPFRDLNAPKYTIGALDGSAYVGYARTNLPLAQVRPYDDFEAMMEDVVKGNLYAVLMDSARAHTWRRDNTERLIQVRTTIDKSRKDPLAIAVAWDDTHLLAWVNLYLETIRGDGTAEGLYRKWFVDVAAPMAPAVGPEAADGSSEPGEGDRH